MACMPAHIRTHKHFCHYCFVAGICGHVHDCLLHFCAHLLGLPTHLRRWHWCAEESLCTVNITDTNCHLVLFFTRMHGRVPKFICCVFGHFVCSADGSYLLLCACVCPVDGTFLLPQTSCSRPADGNYAHALWMSSRTASTLGYNEIQPLPQCPGINLVVMLQVRHN